MNKIEQFNKRGVASQGKTNLLKHLRGEMLRNRQRIVAKYCGCMGHYAREGCTAR